MGVALFQYSFLYQSRSSSLLSSGLDKEEIGILYLSREKSCNQMGMFTSSQL